MAKPISRKNEKLLETLSSKFFKKYGRIIKIRKRLSRYDDYVAFVWNGIIWVETNIADVKLILSQCCDEMGLKGETKKTLIESFFDKNSLDYRNFNVDGKRYFVCLSGVINLEALRNKAENDDRSLSQYINLILKEHLRKKEENVRPKEEK